MNKETITKLQSLCLVSMQMAQEAEKTYELRSLILGICKEIDSIIEDAEIDNDYKQSKRD
tara:strand:- start:865 stop:1044 length:180 start_codon:yes stop_codon:yes gene_type:complete